DSARTQLETLKQQQSAELAAARARVEEARARVAEAKATLKNAQERLRTLKAQQDAELEDAEARVLEAKAALDAARANEMQVSIARSELDAARAAVQQAEAQLEAVKAQEMQIRMKQLDVDAARAALRQAEASLQVARANTLQVKVREAEVKSARAQTQRALAQLDNARKRFTDTTVVAPRDGVVLQKLVEEGTVISSGMSAFAQGTTIVRLGDMSCVFVDTEVDETDIIHVHVGQPVIVSVDAMPGKEFKGRVVRIDPQTTEEQNVVYVHVRVELFNPDPRLKPGMSTTCEFIVAHKPNVLRAPSEAIRETEFGTTVDVLLRNKPLNARGNPHPKPRAVRLMRRDEEEIWWAIARRVRIGLRGDDYTEIINGLREGEMVVVSYLEREEREERRRIGPFGRRLRRRRR
ncbi:MAG TPA: efflux RND transporter periplasmic adaptor subunit, partial [Armatimonadetes bacterium]|nr:efflux RND transporter periplasmic adaptor subunit [Armatimonadota bacterium]